MPSPHVQTVYFSPTGNTKKICSRLAFALGLPADPPIDLTHSKIRQQVQTTAWQELTGDIIIFGVPVYVGRIPDQVLNLLNKPAIDGNSRWIIVIAVNGNVYSGSAVTELGSLLNQQGFRLLAAANFTGKNSLCHTALPLGKGRPDAQDFQELNQFAHRIIDKLSGTPTEITLPLFETKIDYTNDHPQYGARQMAESPKKDSEKCVECRECFAHCPTDAIDFTTLEIDEKRCIRCYSCVKVCAFGARQINLQMTPEMGERFKHAVDQRLSPEFFL